MSHILCLASYFKGNPLLRTLHNGGCHVILIADEHYQHADWAHDAIDEFYPFPKIDRFPDILHAVSYLARERQIDAILPLDDFDVETAAALREHLRLPGLGASQARFFRDKLAMRTQARAHNVPVPDFVAVLNYSELHEFMGRVSPPWVLKPRSEASAMGIRKLHGADELWPLLDELGDKQSFHLLEQFLPGDVYHVDSIVFEGEIKLAAAQKYGTPPMAVYHGGGVFASSTLPPSAEEYDALLAINEKTLAALGMINGTTHAEYIRAEADGQFYFLETAARVGGANLDQLIEAAYGFNPWVEWARVELARLRGEDYAPPAAANQPGERYAGLLASLARQEYPDLSAYDDPEVVWRLDKKQHAGLIVASPEHERVQSLLASYANRFAHDFTAVAPPLGSAEEMAQVGE